MNNNAIIIGIDNYEFIKPLSCAVKDAKSVESFLSRKANFQKVFFFSDDSPDINGKSTRPHRSNLLRVLRQICDAPYLESDDSFWFFFSGHGIRCGNQDYLLPIDGDPEDVENTAISVNEITKTLRRSGAGNLFLILDACRSEGPDADSKGTGVGQATAKIASGTGIVSIFSCSPEERSYEISELEQGAFTYALLEGLDPASKSKCSNVEQLDKYLRSRVPQINSKYGKTPQKPYIAIEPLWKRHLLILPELASDSDISELKNCALEAEIQDDFERASQIWWQLLSSSKIDRQESEKAIERIARKKALFVSEVARQEPITRFQEADKGSDKSGYKVSETKEEGVRETQPSPSALDTPITKENDSSNASIIDDKELNAPTDKIKILVVGLHGSKESILELDEEVREIDEAIRESKNRDAIEIEQKYATTLKDIRRAILEAQPTIVHFCGSPWDGGIAYQDSEGQSKLFTSAQLLKIFELLPKKVLCTTLSRCYSKTQAIEISKHVDYVIGISKSLDVKYSLNFVIGFYDAVGAGESIDFSYEVGCNAIQLAGAEDFVSPTLKKKSQDFLEKKILILASNPVDTARIRLDKEIREIKRVIRRRAKNRDLFEIEEVLAVRPEDIRRKMLDFRPQIVHFCGHGAGQEGLVVENNTGRSELLSTSALGQLFKLFSSNVECVIFGGCYSEIQARAVAQHIDYVIGMNQAISDTSAIAFSIGFYEAIGYGHSFEFAYKLGCSSIQLEGQADYTVPVLIQDPSLELDNPLNQLAVTVSTLIEDER